MPLHPYRDPGTPDARGPARFLWWLARRQILRVLRGGFWGTLSMAGLAMVPLFIGKAIDDGLRARDAQALLWWGAAIVGIGVMNAVSGIARHRTMTYARMDAAMRTVQVVTRRVTRLGSVLPNRVSTGEVVNVGTSDVHMIAEVMTIGGPGVGAIITFVVIAGLVLTMSPVLGAVILLGVPLVMAVVYPLLGRLERTETQYRAQQGELTSRAGDIVAGLRVLRGIGGESLFAGRYRHRSGELKAEGYRVGSVVSWIQALAVGLPGLLLALITWLAARMVAFEQISVGDMVAAYGYTAVLVTPVAFFVEGAFSFTRGKVAASRVTNILNLPTDVDDAETTTDGPATGSPLHDPESALTIPSAAMVGIACRDSAEATAIVERIARYTDSAALFGEVKLREMAVTEIRERILVAGNDAHLFAGTFRQMITTRHADEPTVAEAIRAASAEDVVAGLPDGLDTPVDTQARTLSGGQRQRVRLARAVLADPEILILTEPTSAVDAHTEAAIAERLSAVRAGRITVIVATSPLLMAACDQVSFVVDGRVRATATHARLLREQPEYRALVARGIDDDDFDGANA